MLALCERRIGSDWRTYFDQPLLLLETFVDTTRYRGTVYRAANWICLGQTQGSRRIPGGYSAREGSPKLIFVRALHEHAQSELSRPILQPHYRLESPKMMLAAEHMCALPTYFKDIPDPRRAQGRRHPLHVVLAIAAGATLCGMDGYKAIAGWAKDLGRKARERFGCRIENRRAWSPVKASFAMCLCASIPKLLTAPCNAGTPISGNQTKALPSTARPCATPSTNRDGKPTS